MFQNYNMILMIAMIVLGFIVLIYIINFKPKTLDQGESLCQQYYSFFNMKIEDGKIKTVRRIASGHGAWELEIIESDTLYKFRFYEPLYDSINLVGINFRKKENSFELQINNDLKYKVIRTCDMFLN